MKIIRTDNFDKSGEFPGYDETIVCGNVSKTYGKDIVVFLNYKHSSPYGNYFFRLVEDDYKLREFEGF